MIPVGYYAVLYELPDGQGVAVKFAEHPNVITYGRDWEHAREMAAEALSLSLEYEFEQGFHLPDAKKPPAGDGERVVFVAIDPQVRVAYLLRDLREQAGLTRKAVAERLGIAYRSYQRMERHGRSKLTLATLSRVARALNKEVVIDIQ